MLRDVVCCVLAVVYLLSTSLSAGKAADRVLFFLPILLCTYLFVSPESCGVGSIPVLSG